MTETKKRRRRPAGFERPAGRRFCVFVDVGDVYGRAKIEKVEKMRRKAGKNEKERKRKKEI